MRWRPAALWAAGVLVGLAAGATVYLLALQPLPDPEPDAGAVICSGAHCYQGPQEVAEPEHFAQCKDPPDLPPFYWLRVPLELAGPGYVCGPVE